MRRASHWLTTFLLASRPEAFFDHAVLIVEQKVKLPGADTAALHKQAATLLDAFLEKAGDTPLFREAVGSAQQLKSEMAEAKP